MEKNRKKPGRKKADLGGAPVSGLIVRFAIPSIIGMLVTAAYNITDQIFIGNKVGLLGNAATNVAFPLVMIATAFAQMCGVGTAANFNMNLGAGCEDKAKEFIGTGVLTTGILGAAFGLLVWALKEPLIFLCGATDNVFPYASLYLGITLFGLPFHMFTNASGILIRADGSPSYSMFCTASGAILNVFLDWLFMVKLDWGIRGASIATVCGQVVSALLCVHYYTRFKTFSIGLADLRIRLGCLWEIVKLGTANFCNHMIMATVNIVVNNTFRHYGAASVYGSDIPLAVSGIAAKLNSILVAFVVGLSQGCQPIWSFNMGAKNYGRVKETYKKAVTVSMMFSLVAFAIFQLFPQQITSIFGTGSELYFQFAKKYLRIYMMMVCLFGIQPLSINYFTSIGNARQGIFLSVSRQGFLLIPLLLLLPRIWGLNGALLAGPLADGAAAILSVSLVVMSFRRLDRLEAEGKQV